MIPLALARFFSPIAALSTGIALAMLLGGCAGYSYKLNERVVYQAPVLFDDYDITDPHLRACVEQAIEDQGIQSAEQLQDLNCSSAGIGSLAGIETFSNLHRLGLDDNTIADLTPLYALLQLEQLHLRRNALRSLATQLCVGKPKHIALDGNAALACATLAPVAACGAQWIDTPAHCSAGN